MNGGKVTTTSKGKKIHKKEIEHGNVFNGDVSKGKHDLKEKGSYEIYDKTTQKKYFWY